MIAFNSQAQIIKTVAGNGTAGYSGDGGSATSAQLNGPNGVAVDAIGNLFIADFENSVIRKVSISGVITTVAGKGTPRYSGDGGSATSAELNTPNGVTVDTSGNLFIADWGNNRIRKVNTSGVITTVAGNGTKGHSGDGGSATAAELSWPSGVAVDASGNIFIADQTNHKIRMVNTSGVITTVAGNGYGSGSNYGGYSGDGDSATAAELNNPVGVAVDTSGNLFIADMGNNRIRKVSSSGIISTVAGNGSKGNGGDGGSATAAKLNSPTSVVVDANGNLFIADRFNYRIRKVSTKGIITTIAGNGIYGYNGDGGSATSAELFNPHGVAMDASGNLFIADETNQRIRKVTVGTFPVTIKNYELRITNEKQVLNSWAAKNEINVSHYNIQISTNKNDFKTVGSVKAIGSESNSYSFTDNNPAYGTNYYRLESVDKDGGSNFSKVVSVQMAIDNYQLSIVPNPAKDFATINFTKTLDNATIAVYDFTGKQVISQSLNASANSYKLNTKSLKSGLYVIKVSTGTGNYNEKLLIDK